MHKTQICGVIAVLVGITGAHGFGAAAYTIDTSHPIVIGAHPDSERRFTSCPALQQTGLDSETANALLHSRSVLNEMRNNFFGAVKALGLKASAFADAQAEQTTNYIPVSSWACRVLDRGLLIKFTRSYWSNAIDGFVIDNGKSTVRGELAGDGTGLDGEKRFAVASFGSLGGLEPLQSASVPTCLMETEFSARLGTAMLDNIGGLMEAVIPRTGYIEDDGTVTINDSGKTIGAIAGAMAGAGGKENATLRNTCKAIFADLSR